MIHDLVVLSGVIKVGLATHGDVGEVLLNGENVATHFLDAIFVDALQRRRRINENRCDQMTQAEWDEKLEQSDVATSVTCTSSGV